MLELTKGSDSLLLLSLLYEHIDLQTNNFEQDHIHPYSKFNITYFKKIGFDTSKYDDLIEKRDKISNLQLMVGKKNRIKLASPLEDYLNKIEKDAPGSNKEFIKDNLIPKLKDYSLKNFDKFYDKRRKILKEKLMNLLII